MAWRNNRLRTTAASTRDGPTISNLRAPAIATGPTVNATAASPPARALVPGPVAER